MTDTSISYIGKINIFLLSFRFIAGLKKLDYAVL